MNETLVTLSGWLGTDVERRTAGDAPVAHFRVACTPRRFQKKTGEWASGDTQWYSVSAWRALAVNCERSLRRGDPVVVHGRLSASTWTSSAGVEMTTYDVDASFVGHDLNRGTTAFTRSRPESVDQSAAPTATDGSATSAGPATGSGPTGSSAGEEAAETAA